MKLAQRLALLTAGVTAGTTAACLTIAFLSVRHSAIRELDEVVIDGARAAAIIVTHDDGDRKRGVKSALVIPDDVALMVQRIVVYSSQGQRIASRPEVVGVPSRLDELVKRSGARVNEPFDLDLPEGAMRAVVVQSHSLGGLTVLHAASRAALDATLASRARLFLALFFGTLALVVLSARWLGRRLARDVVRVTEVAQRVANGELTARAGTSGLASPETRHLARELDHMVAELAALVVSQRSFISYAAHELRSPLTALQGELQLALRRSRTEEAYVETLGSALVEVGHLIQLAEDLLTLARAQADNPAIEEARVDEFVDDAMKLVQGAAQIQDSGVELDIDAIRDRLVVGRCRELARLLRNVVENAIKFGPRGGRVRLKGSDAGAHLVIAVEDEGPGIVPKDRPQLFEPFFRGSSQISGTGLGLAIAREIARKAGGDILYDESFVGGTRLVIRLKAVRPGIRASHAV